MSLILYVDTNILMEHEPLDQLPLDSIIGDPVDAIVIPHQVLKELDAQKYAPEKRTRRRAEAAVNLVQRIRTNGALPSGAKVAFARPVKFDYEEHELEPTSQDDRIMAVLLQQKQLSPRDRHVLLTADQHFAVLADELGVECRLMEGHRLLPGESDDHLARPRPSLGFEDGLTFLEASVPLPPHPDQLVADAVKAYWHEPLPAPEGPMAHIALVQIPRKSNSRSTRCRTLGPRDVERVGA